MQIKAPFAYDDVVPVLKSHRIVRDQATVPAALRQTNAIPVTFAELPMASRDYPIVFVKPNANGPARLVALLGLRPGQNLFVDADGHWREGVYRPAYLRRHPFCMATVTRDGQVSSERIICVESAMIDDERGEPVADERGEPLPWWQQTTHFLSEFEADLLRTEKVCDLVEKNGILEPFSAQAVPNGAEVTNLTGMLRVNEARLGRLTADTLRMMINKGVMGRLYAHMMSLDRFAGLLDLHTASLR